MFNESELDLRNTRFRFHHNLKWRIPSRGTCNQCNILNSFKEPLVPTCLCASHVDVSFFMIVKINHREQDYPVLDLKDTPPMHKYIFIFYFFMSATTLRPIDRRFLVPYFSLLRPSFNKTKQSDQNDHEFGILVTPPSFPEKIRCQMVRKKNHIIPPCENSIICGIFDQIPQLSE